MLFFTIGLKTHPPTKRFLYCIIFIFIQCNVTLTSLQKPVPEKLKFLLKLLFMYNGRLRHLSCIFEGSSCKIILFLILKITTSSRLTTACRARSIAAPEKPHSAPDSQGGRFPDSQGGRPVPNKQKGRRKLSEKNTDPFQNIGMKIQRY